MLTQMCFENNEVEIVVYNDKVLFNPYHVGECLGISKSNVRNYVQQMNKNQVVALRNSNVRNMDIRKLPNRGQNFITKSGVYKLIFKSRNPNAEKFQDWVTDIVLPQVEKTGAYIQPQRESEAIEYYFPNFSDGLKLSMVKELQQKNAQLQEFYDDLLSTDGLLDMNTVAKELEIGEYALFAYLRGKKILFYNKDMVNVPYERFRKEGKFKVKETPCHDGKTRNVTYVTRKGLDYIRKTMRKDGMLGVAK